MQRWLHKGKYARLLQLWAQGLTVPWESLYGAGAVYEGARPRRISLPGYPFARERYWVPAKGIGCGECSREAAPVTRSARVLRKVWREPGPGLAGGLPEGLPEELPPSVVIVATSQTEELARQIAGRFRDARVLLLQKQAEVLAEPGWEEARAWIDVSGCAESLDPDVRLDGVVAALGARSEPRTGGGAVRDARPGGVRERADQPERRGPSGAVPDALGGVRASAHAAPGYRARAHSGAAGAADRAGVCTVARPRGGAGDWECARGGGVSRPLEVCYRGGERYVAGYEEEPIAAEEVQFGRAQGWVFPSDQVLWITGGTRGLGLLCARHFVHRHGVRRLVLTGREAFPPRERWDEVQEQAPESALAKKIGAVRELEAGGAEVQLLWVSLEDEQALRQSVLQVKERWGARIGGVIHCAGIVDVENPAFIRKELPAIQGVLGPKVQGAMNLLKSVAGEPLQFCVLFSSVSAGVPALAVGQSVYAQGNAYLDYLAQAYAHRLPMLSIQWPSWKESGMGESRTGVYRELGFHSHSDEEGLGFLDYLLVHRNGAVVLPAIVDESRWEVSALMHSHGKGSEAKEPGTRSERSTPSALAGRSAPHPSGSAPQPGVRRWVKQVVSEELKIPESELEEDRALTDYGVDSILLVQVLKPISERVGEAVDPSILFEYPTIGGLAAWLSERYAGVLGESAQPPSASVEPSPVPLTPRAPSPEALVSPQLAEGDEIAVVGLSCRFAGAASLQEYWGLLSEGRSAIGRVPAQRWGHESEHYAGVLPQVWEFDPQFFLISAADARAMDPQGLLVLEESLRTWYHAGYTLKELKGKRIGVYLGARSQHLPEAAVLVEAPNPIMAVGPNYLATNISRFFDLKGPSVVIDTACSSALVAMSMAMQSLRSGEIESALVGGVGLLANEGALQLFARRGILNEEGAFHLFDGRSHGAVLGEGAGMVWLKSVSQARRDGDTVYALIKALAINNDGRTAGPAAPNLQAQQEVMRQGLARSGLCAQDIPYIEVNGSGTLVTDLLELKAIQAVYRPQGGLCELGSMKPNIGHPLCAEGIASFIKCVLMLHRGERVPFLSGQVPMPHYDLGASPFRFHRSGDPAGEPLTCAAINCFADGGTNAHVILQAPHPSEGYTPQRQPLPPPPLNKIDCRLHGKTERVENGMGRHRTLQETIRISGESTGEPLERLRRPLSEARVVSH